MVGHAYIYVVYTWYIPGICLMQQLNIRNQCLFVAVYVCSIQFCALIMSSAQRQAVMESPNLSVLCVLRVRSAISQVFRGQAQDSHGKFQTMKRRWCEISDRADQTWWSYHLWNSNNGTVSKCLEPTTWFFYVYTWYIHLIFKYFMIFIAPVLYDMYIRIIFLVYPWYLPDNCHIR